MFTPSNTFPVCTVWRMNTSCMPLPHRSTWNLNVIAKAKQINISMFREFRLPLENVADWRKFCQKRSISFHCMFPFIKWNQYKCKRLVHFVIALGLTWWVTWFPIAFLERRLACEKIFVFKKYATQFSKVLYIFQKVRSTVMWINCANQFTFLIQFTGFLYNTFMINCVKSSAISTSIHLSIAIHSGIYNFHTDICYHTL